MGGLNPYALPYVPAKYYEEVKISRKLEKKTGNYNHEGWTTQKTKKERKK